MINQRALGQSPGKFYKNKGWINLGDWLGTGRIADREKTFRTFNEAKIFAEKLNVKTQSQWFSAIKGNNKPDDIPYKPYNRYKKEWKGWADFLGKKDQCQMSTKKLFNFILN